MAFTLALVALAACGGDSEYFIPGSGELPNCTDAPVTDLDGTSWFDNGSVTILTAGCADSAPNDVFVACALDWAFAQTGNEVTVVVDSEYKVEGRLCGDQLYLRGGWWLPVQDAGQCTYADDSADEVSIQAPGNVLTVSAEEMSGVLSVRSTCDANYDVTFSPAVGHI